MHSCTRELGTTSQIAPRRQVAFGCVWFGEGGRPVRTGGAAHGWPGRRERRGAIRVCHDGRGGQCACYGRRGRSRPGHPEANPEAVHGFHGSRHFSSPGVVGAWACRLHSCSSGKRLLGTRGSHARALRKAPPRHASVFHIRAVRGPRSAIYFLGKNIKEKREAPPRHARLPRSCFTGSTSSASERVPY